MKGGVVSHNLPTGRVLSRKSTDEGGEGPK